LTFICLKTLFMLAAVVPQGIWSASITPAGLYDRVLAAAAIPVVPVGILLARTFSLPE